MYVHQFVNFQVLVVMSPPPYTSGTVCRMQQLKVCVVLMMMAPWVAKKNIELYIIYGINNLFLAPRF